jgi:two-component system sensor histidine kinase MprB
MTVLRRPARRRLTLLTRFTIVAAGAVAVTAVTISALAFLAIRGDLEGQLRHQLAQRARHVQYDAARFHGHVPRDWVVRGPTGFGDFNSYSQVITATGAVWTARSDLGSLKPDAQAMAVAAGRSPGFYADTLVDGVPAMVLTVPLSRSQQLALQVAEPLSATDAEVTKVGTVLAVASAAGIAAAALLGWGVARAGLAPVSRLASVAEQVSVTGDPDRRVDVDRHDEIGRLATAFNRMLTALQRSLASQRQLISDASHELRTPLASLRLNVELLAAHPGMPEDERKDILGRVVAQVAELSELVAGVTDLARGDLSRAAGGRRDRGPREDGGEDGGEVRLDEVTLAALEAARRDWPETEFRAALDRCVTGGDAGRLRVAVRNLLDNAAKFGPPGGPVEVSLSGGELTVRDHGPGIAEADIPFVFDRFYRAVEARSVPGSGLGLSVVSEIARAHGGSVRAEAAPGGGALLRLTLPAALPRGPGTGLEPDRPEPGLPREPGLLRDQPGRMQPVLRGAA